MPKSWETLEGKLKRIEEKKAESTLKVETPVVEKPKPAKEGAFSEYIKKVQQAYKQSSMAGKPVKPVYKDKYETMFDKFERPTLTKENSDETKKHFKGMEKRFLRPK